MRPTAAARLACPSALTRQGHASYLVYSPKIPRMLWLEDNGCNPGISTFCMHVQHLPDSPMAKRHEHDAVETSVRVNEAIEALKFLTLSAR